MWLLRGPTTRDAELQRDDAEDTIDEDAIEDPAAEEDTDGDGSALRMGGGLLLPPTNALWLTIYDCSVVRYLPH